MSTVDARNLMRLASAAGLTPGGSGRAPKRTSFPEAPA